MQQFKIRKKIEKIKMLYPVHNRTVDMSKEKYLSFKWKKVKGISFYFLKLYTKKKNEKLILKKKTKHNSYELKDLSVLDIGRYRWEISGELKDDTKISKTSEYFKIILSKQPKEAPDIISPKKQYKEQVEKLNPL